VNIKINGELKEVNVEVWPKCEGVNTPCGKTTDKNTEYFTKDGNYLLRQEEGEKQTADDSEGDDGEDDKTVTYEEYVEAKYNLDIEKRIAQCEDSIDPICKFVKNENYKEALQKIAKEEAENDANEREKEKVRKEKEETEEKARKQKEELEKLNRETNIIKEQIQLREKEREELAEADEQELIIEENEQELIGSRQRLINLEKYEAGMNNGAPVVETGST
jgi:hypothetical protein